MTAQLDSKSALRDMVLAANPAKYLAEAVELALPSSDEEDGL